VSELLIRFRHFNGYVPKSFGHLIALTAESNSLIQTKLLKWIYSLIESGIDQISRKIRAQGIEVFRCLEDSIDPP